MTRATSTRRAVPPFVPSIAPVAPGSATVFPGQPAQGNPQGPLGPPAKQGSAPGVLGPSGAPQLPPRRGAPVRTAGHPARRLSRGSPRACRPATATRIRSRRFGASMRSPGACAANAPGIASRTSARSFPTRSRRPTSSPMRPPTVTMRSSSTSSATSCSRSTSSRCCSRSAARAASPRSPRGLSEKLIRRHPHVFGEAQTETAGEVLRNWDRIKREQEGRGADDPFADVPENLPASALRAKGPAPRGLGRARGRRARRRAAR